MTAAPYADDWRHSAACRAMSPQEFDDGGTPVAWNACRQCPVRPECLKDARLAPERTQGVYRAGRAWGVKAAYTARRTLRDIQAEHQEWIALAEQGHSAAEIARVHGCSASTVKAVLRILRVSA